MKQIISCLLAAFVFISASSFNLKKNEPEKERIEIVFTRNMKYADLVNIKKDLFAKGIFIEYRVLEFDKKRNLKKIGFFVDCNDGFTGSAITSHFVKTNKFGFYRDYDDKANTHFYAGYF
ncbi:MAG: hypothetical protein QM737_15335 [Ferruginibacter sp.]